MFSDLGATIQDTAAMSKAELDFRVEVWLVSFAAVMSMSRDKATETYIGGLRTCWNCGKHEEL